MGILKQRNMDKSIAVFNWVWGTLLLVVVLSMGPVVAQILDITQREQLSMWKQQWFFQDGASGIVFLIGLVLMMYIWAPSQGSSQYHFTAVSTQEGSAKEETAPAVW